MNRSLVGILVSAFGILTSSSSAVLQPVKIAGVGQAAPGVPGAVFQSFDQIPMIDQNGTIVFRAFLEHSGTVSDGNDEGIWSGTPGNFSLIARENSLVPNGTPGVPEGLRFESSLLLGNVSGHGFFFNSGNLGGSQFIVTQAGLSRVAYRDMNMGGDPANPLLFHGLAGPVLALNASGQYAFGGEFLVGSGGVTDSNKSGLWANLDGTLKLIARQGSQVDGMPAGTTWSGDFLYPEISDTGKVFFKGVLSNGKFGFFAFDGVSTHPVALNTDQVSGAPAGTVFGTVPVAQPRINSRGDLVIVGNRLWLMDASGYHQVPSAGGVSPPADVTDNDTVIYLRNPAIYRWLVDGTVQQIATSSQYGTLSIPTISSAGHIAFIGNISLYVAEPGGLPVPVEVLFPFIASDRFTDVEYNQFSASGDLVFTGGTTAHEIYLVHVPEPSALLLLPLAAFLIQRPKQVARVI